MSQMQRKKWNKLWIYPDEIVKITKKYVFIQLKRSSEYEDYVICHVKKLIRQKEHSNQILMLFTDDFQFYLKKYQENNPDQEVRNTIRLTGKEFQQIYK